ncbi:hypothetical protein N2152v2_000775 [Parachlorella kessleri]
MVFSSALAADRAVQLLRSYPLGPTTWLQARVADKGDFKRLLEPLLKCLPAARQQLDALAARRSSAAQPQHQPSTHSATPAQQLPPGAAAHEGPLQPPPLAPHNAMHVAQLAPSLPSSPPALPLHLMQGGAAAGHAESLPPHLVAAPAGHSQQPSITQGAGHAASLPPHLAAVPAGHSQQPSFTHAAGLLDLPPHLQGLGLDLPEHLHSSSGTAAQHAGFQHTSHPDSSLSAPCQSQAQQPPHLLERPQAEDQHQQQSFPPGFGGSQAPQLGANPAAPSTALPAQQAGEALRLKQMLFLAQQKQNQHSQATVPMPQGGSASSSSPPVLPTGSSTRQRATLEVQPAAANPQPSQDVQPYAGNWPGAAASAAAGEAAAAGSWQLEEQSKEDGWRSLSLRSGARADGDWGEDEQAFVTVGGRGGKATSPRSIVGGDKEQGRKLYVRPVLECLNSRQVEKIFARFGALEEVVKFPGATYAFVTYLHGSAAAAAVEALHGKTLPSLTGNEPLLIEYRKLKGAAGSSGGSRDTSAGLQPSSSGSSSSEGGFMSLAAGLQPRGAFEGRRMPDDAPLGVVTTKLWVANIHRNASRQEVEKVFSRFGPVWDVMLAQGGDNLTEFGQWAFVNFKYKADAERAFRELADRVVPALTKSKCTLKLKFKLPNKGC